MKKEKIISEGLLGKYLLGELSQKETIQIEEAIANDADIKSAFEAMEADFERMAFENAIEPPAKVRNALKNTLEENTGRTSYPWPLLAAAGLALLLSISTYTMYTKWQNTSERFEALQQQTTQLQERLDGLESGLQLATDRYRAINNARTIPLVLYGNSLLPDGHAVAYVDHSTKTVLVNALGLPKLPEDKTYQMWSDVNGVMIDMGLVPTQNELIPLKYIDKAESLNITIEPAGGNDHPTVEQLISAVTL